MYRKSSNASVGVSLFFCLLFYHSPFAQFSLTAQLRTRSEWRNGYGNLVLKDSRPAFFTSQRTRLSFGYKWDRLTLGATIQDVRVWGQDASSISSADGNKLMLHEGWAEMVLANKKDTSIKFTLLDELSVKLGRQEFQYDDVRLLGNLDWLQQGRRHDMVLVKTVHKGFQVDVGFAYNQNSDAFGISGTSYLPANIPVYVKNSQGVLVPTPAGIIPLAASGNVAGNSSKSGSPVWTNPPGTNGGNQDYKSFASLYISRKFKLTKISALFFNDNFGKYKLDSVGSPSAGYVYGRRFVSAGSSDAFNYSGLQHRYTYGVMVNQAIGKAQATVQVDVQAAFYAQSGKNRDGATMKDAFHYSILAAFKSGKVSITPGYDVLSGNNGDTDEDERFDPLYGTPHRHWGYMDYFYVGTGSPGGGLRNAYLKFKYSLARISFGADLHHFALHRDMKKGDGTIVGKALGDELDLIFSYNMNKFTNIELGYSTMLATRNMPIAKFQATTDAAADAYRRSANWFYAMIRFTPDLIRVSPSVTKQ